jgi:GMP synthase (glutamine-hydrolysing)
MLCASTDTFRTTMRPLLLIQTGEAPESLRTRFGGFADWFRAAMRIEPSQMRIARVDEGAPLPATDAIAGAVITGSAAMVTERADWSERTAAWIRTAMQANLPVFGVCYGHQLMAHALGGTVGWLPAGREMGTQPIARHDPIDDTAWLAALPVAFSAHTTHRQSVLVPPRDSQVLAASERDPHQLLRYGPHAVSTQFHPEFTVEHMRAYIAARADALRNEGLDPTLLDAGVVETEAARKLLQRFAHAALAGSASASTAAIS